MARAKRARAGRALDNYRQEKLRLSTGEVDNLKVDRHLTDKRLRPRLAATWRDDKGVARSSERICNCGRKLLRVKGQPGGRLEYSEQGGARFRGFQSCMSVWSCPECARKMAVARIADIRAAVVGAEAKGWSAAWQTLTLPHRAIHRLEHTLAVAAGGWRQVRRTYRYRQVAAALGVAGTIRKAEITRGANGWHPHLHVTFFFRRQVTELELEALEHAVYLGWAEWCQACSLDAPLPECCPLEALPLDDAKWADYVGKALGWELTGQEKRARSIGGQQPFELLEAAIATAASVEGLSALSRQRILDHDPAVMIWREYQRATRGARQLSWSQDRKSVV